MKQLTLFFILFIFLKSYPQAQLPKSSFQQLFESLKKVPVYDKNKQGEINSLKRKLAGINETDLPKLFHLYDSLYEAYKLFQYDSSYNYAKKLLFTANSLKDPALINYARIKLGFSLLSSGMYKETLDSLSKVDINAVPDSTKTQYYVLMARYYFDLGDYDNDLYHTPAYNRIMSIYIDSALALWHSDKYEYLYYDGLKNIRNGDWARAKLNFEKILARPDLTLHQVAVTASTLSDFYLRNHNYDAAIPLLIKAVLADAESSTKETSAAYRLSVLLYKAGDIDNASLCISRAFADAVFYGARQRKMQITEILPLIEAQKFAIAEGQKKKIIWYAVLVTVLLILVICLGIIVFKQIKKLKITQAALLDAHNKEQEVNKNLSEVNVKLNDANKIKEEYIGYFFNVNSEFFDKIERFKNAVDQKIADRKIEEIRLLVNAINLKKEKQELLKHFDRAFLKLFPNFVAEFNELFKDEDKIILENNELLNTDLRIFALTRMGIHENEKIAHILQYSVNTINTYKTRIKNKSTVANEEFEKHIMKIKTV